MYFDLVTLKLTQIATSTNQNTSARDVLREHARCLASSATSNGRNVQAKEILQNS